MAAWVSEIETYGLYVNLQTVPDLFDLIAGYGRLGIALLISLVILLALPTPEAEGHQDISD